ncbi:hypothetical protein ACFE04_026157 [Oxalis oulophora]
METASRSPTGMSYSANHGNFTVFKADVKEFTALEDNSVSYVVLQYSIGSINPPQTLSHAAELLFMIQGNLQGFMHFQFNSNAQEPTMVASAFGNANAGTMSLQTTLFATDIDDTILAKTFRTDEG